MARVVILGRRGVTRGGVGVELIGRRHLGDVGVGAGGVDGGVDGQGDAAGGGGQGADVPHPGAGGVSGAGGGAVIDGVREPARQQIGHLHAGGVVGPTVGERQRKAQRVAGGDGAGGVGIDQQRRALGQA